MFTNRQNKVMDKVNKNSMQINMCHAVILLFLASVFLRFMLANYTKVMTVYPDELRYLSIAKSLFQGKGIIIHNIHTDFQKILYSIIIMPIFAIKSVKIQMILLTLINSVVISSGIIPVYLLAKKILNNKLDILIILFIYITLSDLCYSMTIMSEILYLPLALWGCFLFYILLNSHFSRNKSIIINFITGLYIYILYLNKEIAVSFILAYTCYIFLVILFKKCDFKDKIIDLIAMWLGFFLLFIIFKVTIFRGMGNSYNQTGISAIASAYNIVYMMYAFFYNIILIVLSFFYLPVILPSINFRNMKNDCKKFFIFLIWVTIISAAIIAYTISVREDLGRLAPRQHMRYLSFLLMPFLIICLYNLRNIDEKLKKKIIKLLIGSTIIYLLLFIILIKGITNGSNVDQTTLKYIIFAYQLPTLTNGVGEINFNIGGFLLKSSICIVSFSVIYLFFKNTKAFIKVFILLLISINVLNNVCCIKIFKNDNSIQEVYMNDMVELGNYVNQSDGNFLAIMNDTIDKYDNLLDTYLNYDNVYVTKKSWIFDNEKNNLFNINNTRIQAKFPWTNYESLNTINYIIIPKNSRLSFAQDSIKEIKLSDNNCFKVYKNLNPSILTCKGLLEMNIGEKVTISSNDGIYSSQFKIDNNQYISRKNSGYLIYGPYEKIQKGIYNFTFYYKYSNNKNLNSIGNADIFSGKQNFKSVNIPLNPDKNAVTIANVRIDNEIDDLETRIYTSTNGIMFDKVVIEKISDLN